MGARVTVRVVPNMEALPCLQINEQTGSEPSTALFSPARSSSTSWVPTYYTPLVKPIHGLISTFSPVGRLFGTKSRPNTLVWGHGSQSGSFLIWRHYRASKYNETFIIRLDNIGISACSCLHFRIIMLCNHVPIGSLLPHIQWEDEV